MRTRRNRGSTTIDQNGAAKSDRKRPNPITLTSSTTAIVSSSLFKSVSLHDWWLVKDPHGKGLAVGGFAALERLGVRAFCSAAISKRHNSTTIETRDGITITISGLINRSRTHQNGFPSEVCNDFLLGFPYNWEEYAAHFGEESTNRGVSTKISAFDDFNMSLSKGANTTWPFSLDDLPVTTVRDLLMSTSGDPDNCLLTKSIYNDILGKSCGNAFRDVGDSIDLLKESNSPMKNVKSGQNETPMENVKSGKSETSINHEKAKVDQKYNNDNSILNSRDMTTEECQKSSYQPEMDMDTPIRGEKSETSINHEKAKVDQKYNNDNSILNSRDMTTEECQKSSYQPEMDMDTPIRGEKSETSINHEKAKVDQKYNNDNSILNSRDMTTEECQKSSYQPEMDMDTPIRGVSTRSMTRLKNLGLVKGLPLKPIGRKLIEQ